MRKRKTISEMNKKFVDIWFECNFNGGLAWRKLKPGTSDSVSRSCSSRLLSRPEVQEYIEIKKDMISRSSEIRLDFLVTELKNIIDDAKSDEKTDRNSILKALEQLARLAGLYQQKIDMTTNGDGLNDIRVNIIKPK